MKFTIVTPSYNQGRFITDCIESVLQQEGVEIEHIVCDACSTDETVSVLKRYPHLKWVSEPDKGQTDAINKGFRQATGDWLMWLNTDDYLAPGALQKIARYAEAHPQAEIIYGDCDFVSEDKQLLRERIAGDFSIWKLLFYGCFIPSTATFYKGSMVRDGALLDPRFKVCMDFDYYMRLACAGHRFEYIPESFASFRWHDSNVSSVYAQKRYQERVEVQRAALKDLGLSWMGKEWILSAMFHFWRACRLFLRCIGCNRSKM